MTPAGLGSGIVAKTDWNPVLRGELDAPYWSELQAFVEAERSTHRVFPPHDQVFAALHLTPFESVRAVILGQDPYHGPGQAHGLCFSVPASIEIPPSLRNVYAERHRDIALAPPEHGNLEAWARQGVLLLNTTLTVRAGRAGSHQGKGWERFTDSVIEAVAAKPERVVFILWGAAARRKRALIAAGSGAHTIIESAHPSPLSAHNGFFGSRPFSRANAALVEAGCDPIDWRVDGEI
jgi:uracil-DNA glycosylase